jgi:hypothetical protein
MSHDDRARTKSISAGDVDDVVGLATALEEEASQRVDVEDMKAIAAELRIDPKYVEPAIARLAQERAQALETEARTRAARRRLAKRVVAAVAALAVLVAVGAGWTRASLGAAWAEVERARAQVESVRARRSGVEALYRDREASRDRDAELLGAMNRIGVERRRYDAAAAAYNARRTGLACALFCAFTALPARAPLSAEIEGW